MISSLDNNIIIDYFTRKGWSSRDKKQYTILNITTDNFENIRIILPKSKKDIAYKSNIETLIKIHAELFKLNRESLKEELEGHIDSKDISMILHMNNSSESHNISFNTFNTLLDNLKSGLKHLIDNTVRTPEESFWPSGRLPKKVTKIFNNFELTQSQKGSYITKIVSKPNNDLLADELLESDNALFNLLSGLDWIKSKDLEKVTTDEVYRQAIKSIPPKTAESLISLSRLKSCDLDIGFEVSEENRKKKSIKNINFAFDDEMYDKLKQYFEKLVEPIIRETTMRVTAIKFGSDNPLLEDKFNKIITFKIVTAPLYVSDPTFTLKLKSQEDYERIFNEYHNNGKSVNIEGIYRFEKGKVEVSSFSILFD